MLGPEKRFFGQSRCSHSISISRKKKMECEKKNEVPFGCRRVCSDLFAVNSVPVLLHSAAVRMVQRFTEAFLFSSQRQLFVLGGNKHPYWEFPSLGHSL